MPKTTYPAEASLQDFLDSTQLSNDDLVRVWDRSNGKWAWTTLADLATFLNAQT